MTHILDAGRIEEAITPSIKAVVPVHLYGQPVDMPSVMEVCRAHDLRVVEDAAQAHGASCDGERIGGHGDAVCWSFYPGKNLGAFGDAGAVTTNSPEIAERVALLGNYGSREKYINEEAGVNSRLDPVQAAILRVKLAVLEEWTDRRRAVAKSYLDGLAGSSLVLPRVGEWADPVWHLFVVRTSDRAALMAALQEEGVGTLVHYPRAPHMQQAYASLALPPESLPIARLLADEVLSLPMGPHLGPGAVDHVIECLTRLA